MGSAQISVHKLPYIQYDTCSEFKDIVYTTIGDVAGDSNTVRIYSYRYRRTVIWYRIGFLLIPDLCRASSPPRAVPVVFTRAGLPRKRGMLLCPS